MWLNEGVKTKIPTRWIFFYSAWIGPDRFYQSRFSNKSMIFQLHANFQTYWFGDALLMNDSGCLP